MIVLFYLSLSLGSLSVIAYNLIKLRRAGYIGLAVKLAASLFFLLAGIFGGVYAGAPLSYLLTVCIGLTIAVGGDFLVEYVTIRPKYKAGIFLAGLLCFGISHLCYIAGALFSTEPSILGVYIPVTSAFVLAVIIIYYIAPLLKIDFKRMISVCSAYAFILFFMMGTGISVCVENGFQATWSLFFAAGLIFLTSNVALTRMFFGKTEGEDLGYTPAPRYCYYLHNATTHIAQYLIALSLFFF